MKSRSRFLQLLLCCAGLITTQAYAWDSDGHHAVGAIADQLITKTHAANEVKALLGNDLSLRDAAVWADCARGIDPAKGYSYQKAGLFPECKIYENPDGKARMSDFVRRNDNNCDRKPTEESCHKQYHYSDIAIQHDHYDPSFQGARNDDIVAAVAAAIQVLKGEPAAPPFSFKDKREALLVLAHYVGDIHQPLHVGSVYLDASGKPVDPDSGSFDATTETRGGNEIVAYKNEQSIQQELARRLGCLSCISEHIRGRCVTAQACAYRSKNTGQTAQLAGCLGNRDNGQRPKSLQGAQIRQKGKHTLACDAFEPVCGHYGYAQKRTTGQGRKTSG